MMNNNRMSAEYKGMTVAELIEKLKEYPPDMRIATDAFPFDDVELKICRYESDKIKPEDEFDYVAII